MASLTFIKFEPTGDYSYSMGRYREDIEVKPCEVVLEVVRENEKRVKDIYNPSPLAVRIQDLNIYCTQMTLEKYKQIALPESSNPTFREAQKHLEDAIDNCHSMRFPR